MVLEQMKWDVIINKFEKVKISICEFGLLFWRGTWSFRILREHEKTGYYVWWVKRPNTGILHDWVFLGEPLQTVLR